MKYGNATLGQVEAVWNNLGGEAGVARFLAGELVVTERNIDIPVVPSSAKFGLLADLGIITVPKGYDHATWLKTFRKQNYKKFYSYNDDSNDANFARPTRVLKPGDKLHVRAFQQIVPGTTTSEERLAFLAAQQSVHVGAQGLSLVFEQKRDLLPKNKWYSAFDEKDRLWQDAGGRHWVPGVIAHSGGDFRWDLGSFESVWHENYALLEFRDVA